MLERLIHLRIIAILAAFFISLFNRLEGLFHQLSLIQMVEREDPEAWKGFWNFGNANFGCLEGIRGAFMWSCHWNPTCLWCFIGKADNLPKRTCLTSSSSPLEASDFVWCFWLEEKGPMADPWPRITRTLQHLVRTSGLMSWLIHLCMMN